jgi:hypothetical protein
MNANHQTIGYRYDYVKALLKPHSEKMAHPLTIKLCGPKGIGPPYFVFVTVKSERGDDIIFYTSLFHIS